MTLWYGLFSIVSHSILDYCLFHVLVQTDFRRYYFFCMPDQAETHFDRRTLVPNFIQIRQRVNNFPIDPHCKNCPLSATLYNVAESGQFLQSGSMGKFFTHCRLWMKFGTRVRLTPSNDRGEFELDRTRSKNNIAEYSFAQGHKTDNRNVAFERKWQVMLSNTFIASVLHLYLHLNL